MNSLSCTCVVSSVDICSSKMCDICVGALNPLIGEVGGSHFSKSKFPEVISVGNQKSNLLTGHFLVESF